LGDGVPCLSGCTGLIALAIPNTITSVGKYGVFCCTNLASLDLSDFNGTIKSYGIYNTNLKAVYSSSNPNINFKDDGFYNIGSMPVFYTPNGTADVDAIQLFNKISRYGSGWTWEAGTPIN
jgi:hypothetical protein